MEFACLSRLIGVLFYRKGCNGKRKGMTSVVYSPLDMELDDLRDRGPIVAPLKSLNPKHKALIRELVSGCTQTEAAERVGYKRERVSQLMSDPLFLRHYRKMQGRVDRVFAEAEGSKQTVAYHRARLVDEIGPSIETLVKVRDTANSEAERRRSAMDLLSLTPLKEAAPIEVPEIKVTVNANFASFLMEEQRRQVEVGLIGEDEVVEVEKVDEDKKIVPNLHDLHDGMNVKELLD